MCPQFSQFTRIEFLLYESLFLQTPRYEGERCLFKFLPELFCLLFVTIEVNLDLFGGKRTNCKKKKKLSYANKGVWLARNSKHFHVYHRSAEQEHIKNTCVYLTNLTKCDRNNLFGDNLKKSI
jgi:hypothetical protein